MREFLRGAGVGMGVLALALHVFVMTCFGGRWDKTAAVTIFPIWLWSLIGLGLAGLGWWGARGRLTGLAVLVWLTTFLLCPDEWRGVWRGVFHRRTPPPMVRPASDPHLRVVTLNCLGSRLAAAREALAWNPDIIFLQEMRSWQHARLLPLARELWGEEGSVVIGSDTAILARGRLRPRAMTPAGIEQQYVQATLTRPDGKEVEVVSVHLQGHVTDLRLWRWQTWRDHARNQRKHRLYISDVMARQLQLGGALPCLIGGDFNSPAGDRAFQTLERHFDDAFAEAGVGWGNSFRNDWPLLRIDQVWSTEELVPTGARAVKTLNSDHRMVVADFELK